VRPDRVRRLPAYPLLGRVTGSACQDITGTPRVRRQLGSVALPPTRSLRACSVGRDKKAFSASLSTHSLRECLVARDQTLLHTECATSIVEHSFACGVTEGNMGQSLYLCFDSAGFCVGTRHGPALSSCKKSWGRHCADNNAGAQRYPFFGSFSDIWRSRHSASPGGRT